MDYNKLMELTSKMTQTTKDKFGNNKVDYTDNRFWKLSVDENDTGQALIRFLPVPESMIKSVESLPPFYTDFYEHSWSYTLNGKKKFMYARCKGKKKISTCPICAKSAELDEDGKNLWQRNPEEWKKRCAKVKYIANILVVKDPKFPENNGKNFLFIFGKEIKTIIDKALEGEESLVETIDGKDVINFENGYDFLLTTAKEAGQAIRSYGHSKFLANPSKIGYYKDDQRITYTNEEIMKIWESEYNIEDIVNNQSSAFPKFYSEDDKVLSSLNFYLNVTNQNGNNSVASPAPEKEQLATEKATLVTETAKVDENVENFINEVSNDSSTTDAEKIDIDGIDLSGLDLDDDIPF